MENCIDFNWKTYFQYETNVNGFESHRSFSYYFFFYKKKDSLTILLFVKPKCVLDVVKQLMYFAFNTIQPNTWSISIYSHKIKAV